MAAGARGLLREHAEGRPSAGRSPLDTIKAERDESAADSIMTKPTGHRSRLANRCKSLLLIALAGGGVTGCREAEERVPKTETAPAQQELTWVGKYAMSTGTLYRRRDGVQEPVAVLPGAGIARDTVVECAVLAPGLGAVRFGQLRMAPDSAHAAWATVGPGTCVGTVAAAAEPSVRVLGFWPAAATDSLLWAPGGDYLAVLLDHHGQRTSVSVYDAVRGVRLEMPWESECEFSGECDVEEAEWLGGSLLDVRIRLGPAERSVPFEVNVRAAASLDTDTEEEY